MNLAQLLKRMQELHEAAMAEHRELTDEERREWDSLQQQVEEIRGAQPAGGQPAQAQGTDPAPAENGAQRAAEKERTRCLAITNVCRGLGIDEATMQRYISSGMSINDVNAEIVRNQVKNSTPIPQGRAQVTADEADKFRSAAADALVMRSGVGVEKPAEGANELMGMSMKDLARECLHKDGNASAYRMSADELFASMQREFLNPTSAFPAILDNAIKKAYVEGHKKAPVTFDRWTKKGTLTDFKINDNNYVAGPAPEFLLVPENGELKASTFEDAKRPTRQLHTYGRQFTLTRQAFINDDIGLITRLPARYAAAARKTINKQCYEALINNAAIYDGVPLFDDAHKNVLKTGTGVDRKAMQSMIMALQNQTDEFGDAIMVRPQALVVPSGMEFDVYTMFNSATINTADNTQAVNPLFQYRTMEIITDPTINVLAGGLGNVMPWFLLGAPEDTDFVEVDYLNGNEIPTMRRNETVGKLGFVWDIFLDWGISVMDYRGAIKNPGVAVTDPLA